MEYVSIGLHHCAKSQPEVSKYLKEFLVRDFNPSDLLLIYFFDLLKQFANLTSYFLSQFII